jgi:hypothetical protein
VKLVLVTPAIVTASALAAGLVARLVGGLV